MCRWCLNAEPGAKYLWSPQALITITLKLMRCFGCFQFTLCDRLAQLRKREGPNYQHKCAAGRKSLFRFDVEISLQYGRNSGTTFYLIKVELLQHFVQLRKLSRAARCAHLLCDNVFCCYATPQWSRSEPRYRRKSSSARTVVTISHCFSNPTIVAVSNRGWIRLILICFALKRSHVVFSKKEKITFLVRGIETVLRSLVCKFYTYVSGCYVGEEASNKGTKWAVTQLRCRVTRMFGFSLFQIFNLWLVPYKPCNCCKAANGVKRKNKF